MKFEAVDEIHQTWKYKTFSLTPAASALLGLAITIATAGTASTIAGGVYGSLASATSSAGVQLAANIAGKAVAAGFSSLVSSAGVSFANNRGNLLKTFEDLASSENIRGIVMAMAVAGATYGVGDLCGVKMDPANGTQAPASNVVNPPSFLDVARDRMGAHAVQVGVSTGAQVATGKMDLKEALQQGVINVVANTGAELWANYVGDLRGQGSLSYGEQKFAHFVGGAVAGAAMSRDNLLKGALTGGGAAVVAEFMAEELPCIWSQQTRSNIIKMTAGVGAFLFGGDVNIAAMAASNAVENNAFAHDAVTKEGLQRQQEELNAYREAGVDLCKLASSEISDTWSAFLDRLAAPLAASYQENQQAMRQRDLSWLDRIHLNNLDEDYRLLLAGAGLVPRNYLDCGLIAAPLARGARAAQGILAREGVLGAEALAPLGKIEVKPNVMFGGNAAAKPAKEAFPGKQPGRVFNTPTEWTAPSGTKQTYKVFQRNDINWNQVRTAGPKDFVGKTNLEAAQTGRAPQLKDGNFATLHHIGQDSRGPLAEASTGYHGVPKRGQKILHGQYGVNKPNPQNPVDRERFAADNREYWKMRGKNANE